MRRPSPAMVVALLAIVLASAGSAVAATFITSSSQVKDGTLKGKDLKRNTVKTREVCCLTGRDVVRNGLDGSDVDENTFDVVPQATRARSADTAGRADAVTGAAFTRIASRQVAGSGVQTVYDGGGLRLQADCSATGQLTVTAVPSGPGAGQVRVSAVRPGGTTFDSDADFTGTDTTDLLPANANDVSGTLTFLSAADEVTTVQYLAHETDGCVFAGTAVRTSP